MPSLLLYVVSSSPAPLLSQLGVCSAPSCRVGRREATCPGMAHGYTLVLNTGQTQRICLVGIVHSSRPDQELLVGVLDGLRTKIVTTMELIS